MGQLRTHGSRSRAETAYPAMLRMGVIFALALGVWVVASPLAGGIILAVGSVFCARLRGDPARRPPPGGLRFAHPHGGRRHVLVVANAPLAGDELADTIVGLAGPDTELDVVAPQLVSHAHFAMPDTDREARDAEARSTAYELVRHADRPVLVVPVRGSA